MDNSIQFNSTLFTKYKKYKEFDLVFSMQATVNTKDSKKKKDNHSARTNRDTMSNTLIRV